MPLNSIVAGDVAFGVNLRKNSTRGPIIRKKNRTFEEKTVFAIQLQKP